MGESRSQFFRRAVEERLRREKDREAIARCIKGYLENPETQEEVALPESTLGYVLAENPWEDDAEE